MFIFLQADCGIEVLFQCLHAKEFSGKKYRTDSTLVVQMKMSVFSSFYKIQKKTKIRPVLKNPPILMVVK